MKYEKPAVVELASAIKAIQDSTKDGLLSDTEPSDPAYQSDE